jgi:hypothetical protein
MGLENTAEGLRAVFNLATDPQALRAIQRLPGELGEQIQGLLSTFNAAAKSGTLGPDIQNKLLFGRAPKARPIPTKAEATQQLSLPLRTRSGRQVTSSAPRPTARNLETIRAGSRERAVDLPQVRLPGEVRGQMSVFSAPEPQFKYSIHQAPEPEFGPTALPMSLREADTDTANLLRSLEPGTASSLARLADDIAVEYGVSAGEALKNITGPKGTDYLAYLNTSRRAVPASGGQMSPPPPAGGGQVPSGGRPGALAQTTRGGAQRGATGLGDEVIDVDFSLIRDLPAGRRGGALGVTTTDLGRAVRESGLTPTQIKAMLAGGGALGVGTALGLMGREEDRQRVAPLTNEQAYPPQGAGRAASQAPAAVPPSVIGQTGSGQVVIEQNDRDSQYRQARSNALQAAQRGGASAPGAGRPAMAAPVADPNAAIGKYYQQRQDYVSQPEVLQQIIRDVSALPGAAPQTPIWAAQNPTLAYEMLQRAKARPDLSQQMPQLGTVELGSQLGDNPVNNAAGNAAYGAAAAVDRSAGASDLEDATRPLIRPKLNYVPLGGRFVPSGGSIPAIPVG